MPGALKLVARLNHAALCLWLLTMPVVGFVATNAWGFPLIWFGLQVMQGTSELASPDMAAGVAWWAHIGGFVFGALFAVVASLFATRPQTRSPRAWYFRCIATTIRRSPVRCATCRRR